MRVERAAIFNRTSGKQCTVYVPEHFLRDGDAVDIALIADSAHDEPALSLVGIKDAKGMKGEQA